MSTYERKKAFTFMCTLLDLKNCVSHSYQKYWKISKFFFTKNNVIPKEQYGFFKRRSTETNLLCCIHTWSRSLECKQPTDIIHLDFVKAFKKVPFVKPQHKLKSFDIRSKLLSWNHNYLTTRSFRVKVIQSYLSDRLVTSGRVAQGSI